LDEASLEEGKRTYKRFLKDDKHPGREYPGLSSRKIRQENQLVQT
jgi:hypothetical protein